MVLGLIGGSAGLALLCALLRPEPTGWPLAGVLGLTTLVAWVSASPWPRASAAGALSLGLLLLPELLLRLAGLGSPGGVVVHFGWPRPQHLLELQPDAELFWTLPPGSEGVNELGLAGPLPESPKPEGRRRVVLLGDSVTQFGLAEALQEALGEAPFGGSPGADWDAVNLGVVGYSAVQGRDRLARWLPELQADVVVVGFGWNDHWLAPVAPDLALAERPLRPGTLAHTWASSARLLQLLRSAPSEGIDCTPTARVGAEDFEAALLEIIDLSRDHGAAPVLWTLPSSHAVLGVPDYLVAEGFADSPDLVTGVHAAYAGLVLEAGRRAEAPVVDLLDQPLTEQQARTRFTEDGIHLTDVGRGWVAEALAEGITEGITGGVDEARDAGG